MQAVIPKIALIDIAHHGAPQWAPIGTAAADVVAEGSGVLFPWLLLRWQWGGGRREGREWGGRESGKD